MNGIQSAVVLALAGLVSLPSAAGAFEIFQAAGAIQAEVDAFRAALGDPNNANAPGPLAVGRREINWDGGGNNATGTAAVTPFTVFQDSRGGTFTTPGEGLTQSAIDGGTGAVDISATVPGIQLDLADFNAGYAAQFTTFSPLRLFAPVGSTLTEGTFSIPGTGGAEPAFVSGFGAVFTDVDLPDSSSIQFFDTLGNLISSEAVPAIAGSATLSFLGLVVDPGELGVARVVITSGNAALGADDGGSVDVAVMDDFLYGEPQAIVQVAQPHALVLLGMGLLAMSMMAWGTRHRWTH